MQPSGLHTGSCPAAAHAGGQQKHPQQESTARADPGKYTPHAQSAARSCKWSRHTMEYEKGW